MTYLSEGRTTKKISFPQPIRNSQEPVTLLSHRDLPPLVGRKLHVAGAMMPKVKIWFVLAVCSVLESKYGSRYMDGENKSIFNRYAGIATTGL